MGFRSAIDQVAAGDAFSVVVTADGKLWTWGANDQGQLGLGDLRDRSVPTQVKVNVQIHTLPGRLMRWTLLLPISVE